MIVGGIDVGTRSTKAVLLEDGDEVMAAVRRPTRGELSDVAEDVLDDVLAEANVMPGEVDYLCTTGFGRYHLDARDLQISDITAGGRGAAVLHPPTRHVLDIGKQATRAMRVEDGGRVEKFKMTQKCAAGAGGFVERCSKYLKVPLEEMGPQALRSEDPQTISSVCAVLAETEIINYVTEEVPVEDILMGVFRSLADKAHGLMRGAGLEPDVVLVGGLARSEGMIRALEDVTGLAVHVPEQAPYAQAIGAATLGRIRQKQRMEEAA